VRDGDISDPSFFPVIYEALRDEDWTDEGVWKRVNPSYGVSIKRDFLKQECERAKNDPAYENTFKRLYLNIQTEQLERWIVMEDWNNCKGRFSLAELVKKICYGGLDIASNDDIAGFVLFFPHLKAVLPFLWIPEDNILKFEKYQEWVDRGFLLTNPGNTIDHGVIKGKILECNTIYSIVDFGFDPWQAAQMSLELQEEEGMVMVKFPQNFGTFSEPSKKFFKLILDHELKHNNHPVLNWMASNAAIKHHPNDENLIMPIKAKSYGKIDGITGSIMAVGRSMMDLGNQDSVYKKREAVVL
jgi:phage terminase large subunit-like protein